MTSEPTWNDRLRTPFPAEMIFYKPRPWCRDCSKAPDRVCSRHVKRKCPRCHNNITEAHTDLEYVGHADVTARLLEVDAAWYWEPAYKDVDRDLMLSAIATGNDRIVAALIANSPPLLDKYGGMWMYLTVHDDEGNEVTRLAYGDAQEKTGPDAVKETIGDGVRNGAMRFGVALDQWSKSDRPHSETTQQAIDSAKATSPTATTGTDAKTDAHYDERAAELAVLAWELAEKQAGQNELKAQVYEPARRARLLSATVANPWEDDVVECRLTDVISAAKKKMWPSGSEGEAAN